MAALSPPLGRILDLGVRVTLVRVPEPCCTLFLAAHEGDPLVAASTEAFPDIGVPIHAPGLLGLLERIACRSADAVCERLVVPEGRVLQDEPAAGLADSTPTFPLVTVSSHPSGRIEIALKAQLLFVGNEVGIRRVHVLWWRWNLLFMQRGIKVRGVREISVVTV